MMVACRSEAASPALSKNMKYPSLFLSKYEPWTTRWTYYDCICVRINCGNVVSWCCWKHGSVAACRTLVSNSTGEFSFAWSEISFLGKQAEGDSASMYTKVGAQTVP